ncbi:MAG TPA: UDP-N-acetylglucosamine--N-acetylmuramyl-(pentapeptide) pyrophosphoryl-undecaprenol N-acetylglucosamine transferase [bacterium]|nr:UDP-N-acetylglucosamine--N-acetylmuramyl-(pentapeptide) pyrophosphoryl-undecaprenol N-acetylglucosamine transferase [bacterium]
MSGKPKKFIFTGGGSGGHVSPALAVAAELKKKYPSSNILYVGVKNKAEGLMVPKAGIPLKFVNSAPFPGKSPVAVVKFVIAMVLGIIKAKLILLTFRPDVVFATGGYVSAPIVFTAWMLRKFTFGLFKTKILIHESNVHPGKMNKWAASAADEVAVSFNETIKCLPKGKGFFSGYPVRSTIAAGDKDSARHELGIPENAFVVFAFGGSQGARAINRALADAAAELLKEPDIYIVHGTGKPFGENYEYHGFNDVQSILKEKHPQLLNEKRYMIKDFIDNMGLYYAASDLLVIRAGAGSIMEVCRQGKPSIIIPISGIYSDHQTGNARYIERAGAAKVIYEKTDPVNGINTPFVDSAELAETVNDLKPDQFKLYAMSKTATTIFPGNPAEIIVDYILYFCGIGEKPGAVEGVTYQQDRILGLGSVALEQFMKNIKNGTEKKLDSDEMRLLKNKIDSYLSSGSVILKARGLRISGLANYCEMLPLVVRSATGDHEKPFVRRDAFDALSKLTSCNRDMRHEIFSAVMTGLDDKYYEARFAAARCIPVFLKQYGLQSEETEKLLEKLYANLDHRCFEVRVESILAVSWIENDGARVLKQFSRCYFDKVWKVREAIYKGMGKLVERHVIDPDTALKEMDSILITSNGYLTEYELKKQYNKSRSVISKEVGK